VSAEQGSQARAPLAGPISQKPTAQKQGEKGKMGWPSGIWADAVVLPFSFFLFSLPFLFKFQFQVFKLNLNPYFELQIPKYIQ
jgi:hypothetical protein